MAGPRKTLHRSENLHIFRDGDAAPVHVEIRFSESSTLGSCDGVCPRCGALGKPAYWELEGPDGTQNTIWMGCPDGERERNDACDGEFTWSKTVEFAEWRDAM